MRSSGTDAATLPWDGTADRRILRSLLSVELDISPASKTFVHATQPPFPSALYTVVLKRKYSGSYKFSCQLIAAHSRRSSTDCRFGLKYATPTCGMADKSTSRGKHFQRMLRASRFSVRFGRVLHASSPDIFVRPLPESALHLDTTCLWSP